MSDSILSAPYFHSEQAAYEFVKARVWHYQAKITEWGRVKKFS